MKPSLLSTKYYLLKFMSAKTTAAKPAIKKAAPDKAADNRVARVRALVTPVNVPGGKIAKGAVADPVPLEHAKFLEESDKAEILKVYTA